MPTAHVALPPDRRTPTTLELAGLGATPGTVAIMAVDTGEALLADLGPVPPVVLSTSGWETITRPKKRNLVEWMGRDPLRVQFQVMLNGLDDRSDRRPQGRSVERACRSLEKFGGALHGQPPFVLFDSAGVIPYDNRSAPGKRWVVESVDWGDSIRDGQGQRVRQYADVTLLQFNEDESEVRLPGIGPRAPKRKYVEARQGESLKDIAQRTGSKLADLKELNDIRDGSATLKKGRRIRIK